MAEKVDIWMPLYLGDYLADTSHLDTTQHGAYMLLLMHYWRKGPLANDPQKLCNITKLDHEYWNLLGAVLMEFFELKEDGMLHQKRMDLEREKWLTKGETASAKASKAAAARWHKDATSIAQSTPQAVLESCPLPLPLPNTNTLAIGQSLPPSVESILLNKGEFALTADMLKEFSGIYPAVNVRQSFRDMKGWCLANPTKRKTKSGIMKFINSWLSREQNRGTSSAAAKSGPSLSNPRFFEDQR